MKPPAYDQRPMHWTLGAVFAFVGLFTLVVDKPLVPLSYVAHLVPIAMGGAVGLGVLRERKGPLVTPLYVVFVLWVAYACLMDKTSLAPVFLAAGTFAITRALILTFDE